MCLVDINDRIYHNIALINHKSSIKLTFTDLFHFGGKTLEHRKLKAIRAISKKSPVLT